jgi:hypothetical protein
MDEEKAEKVLTFSFGFSGQAVRSSSSSIINTKGWMKKAKG